MDLKNKITYHKSIFLLAGLTICLLACNSKGNTNTTEPKQTAPIKKKSDTSKLRPNKPKETVTSKLRPYEPITLNQVYTDTIHFIRLNNDADYWYFLAQKNKDTIQIIYHSDLLVNTLEKGDKIVINWKMKRLQEAGDDEITYVKPYLMSFKKISSNQSTNKGVHFLWRENEYDEEQQGIVSTIFINESYCNRMSNQERAALGYTSFNIGSECRWDYDKANKDRSNLKCKILTALHLGYQCSEKHLGFLKQWFSKDTVALNHLKTCKTMPYTATVQTTFEEIFIQTDTLQNKISINFDAMGIHLREGRQWRWSQTDIFSYNSESVVLVNTKSSDVKETVSELSED